LRFVTFSEVEEFFRGKRVAVIGSAPSVLDNDVDFIDAHDVVVRVNNYKLFGNVTGERTDVHYSFYGTSIRKTSEELKRDGVKLCMCKCPNGQPIESDWHRQKGKLNGIDFRYIYGSRKDWWPCDTFVPTTEHFLKSFELLDKHIPSTGFAAILDVLACRPRSAYLTGFDFFESGVHNVNEAWRSGDSSDPIGHRPDLELAWLAKNFLTEPLEFDECLNTRIQFALASEL